MLRTISPARFDAIFTAGSMPSMLCGAVEIARATGGVVSAATIRRTWAPDPDSPVKKVGGRYIADRRRLLAWLRGA